MWNPYLKRLGILLKNSCLEITCAAVVKNGGPAHSSQKKRWIYGLIIKDFEFFTYSPSENLCLKSLCIFLEKCRCTIVYGKNFFQTDPVPVLILGSPSQSFGGGVYCKSFQQTKRNIFKVFPDGDFKQEKT